MKLVCWDSDVEVLQGFCHFSLGLFVEFLSLEESNGIAIILVVSFGSVFRLDINCG